MRSLCLQHKKIDVGSKMNNIQIEPGALSEMVVNRDRAEADFSEAFNVIQSLLSQAETIISTCRIVAEGRQGKRTFNEIWDRGGKSLQAAEYDEQPSYALNDKTAAPKSRKVYKRCDYEQMDVDVLQLFRTRIPDLGIGPIMILTKILSNCGSIVSGPAIRAAIGTESSSSVKVYVSRIRKAFRKNGITVEISQLNSGYGLPSDSLQTVLKGFNFSESEVQFLSNAFSKGSDIAEAEA